MLWLLAGAGEARAQTPEIHGADSLFVSRTLRIVWAVLKAPVEEKSMVVTRIVNPAGGYGYVSVEGVDPFTGRRTSILDGLPLEGPVDARSPRAGFADYPRREIHLYVTREDWRARRPALTVYYLGVPDTTPEFTAEASMLSYLETAGARPR